MRSCIFLFLSNAIVGLLTNTLRNSGLICRMCQFFLTISDMFGSVLLMLTLVVCFSCCYFFHYFEKYIFLQLSQTSPFKLSSLYFLSKNFFVMTAQFLWYPFFVEDIVFNLNAWLYAILLFNALGYSDLA